MGESGWGGKERRRGRERPGGRGEDSGPRPGDATEPRSPAGGGGGEREHAGGSEPRRPAAPSSNHRFPPPHPPQTLPIPPRAPPRNLAPAPTTIVPAHLTPPPWERAGVAAGGAGHWGAREPAGRGLPAGAGQKVGPLALAGQRGGGEEGEERLRAGRIQPCRRRGEERCGDRDARQPRKYSAGKQRAGAGEGRLRRDGRGAETPARKERAPATGRWETEKGGGEAEGGSGEAGAWGDGGRRRETEEAGRGRAAGGGGAAGERAACLGPGGPGDSKSKPSSGTGKEWA